MDEEMGVAHLWPTVGHFRAARGSLVPGLGRSRPKRPIFGWSLLLPEPPTPWQRRALLELLQSAPPTPTPHHFGSSKDGLWKVGGVACRVAGPWRNHCLILHPSAPSSIFRDRFVVGGPAGHLAMFAYCPSDGTAVVREDLAIPEQEALPHPAPSVPCIGYGMGTGVKATPGELVQSCPPHQGVSWDLIPGVTFACSCAGLVRCCCRYGFWPPGHGAGSYR